MELRIPFVFCVFFITHLKIVTNPTQPKDHEQKSLNCIFPYGSYQIYVIPQKFKG